MTDAERSAILLDAIALFSWRDDPVLRRWEKNGAVLGELPWWSLEPRVGDVLRYAQRTVRGDATAARELVKQIEATAGQNYEAWLALRELLRERMEST